jgi:integrase
MQASWSGVGVVQDDADPAKPSPVFERYRRTSSARRPWGRPGYASISCVAVLRAYRRRQAAERVAFGSGFCDHGRVFTRPGGEPLNPDAVSLQFKRRAARLGLPPIRFHDLRHGWATMALEAGEHPKVVAEQLGHASVRVTLDTYSHVAPGVQRGAVARVASRFLDPPVSSVLANEPASRHGQQEAGS